MAEDTRQRFVSRTPPPRVAPSYDDPDRPGQPVELPFVVGVLADLSAAGQAKTGFCERRFFDVDAGTAALQPERLAASAPSSELQRLEAAWCGIRHLLDRVPAGSNVRIRVLDVDRAELEHDLGGGAVGRWRDSDLFKRLHDDVYLRRGADPFVCIVADFTFSHAPADVAVLGGLARIAEAVQAPLLAAVAPRLLGVASWPELATTQASIHLEGTDYDAWNALRDDPASRFVGLCGPRLRSFAEGRPLWINAAWALAGNAVRSFAAYGWAARITGVEGGGRIDGLVVDGDGQPPLGSPDRSLVETVLTERQDVEWARAGLIPVLRNVHASSATFFSAPSLYRPVRRKTVEARTLEMLRAQLPATFAASRFVHCLRARARDGGGTDDLQAWLDRHVEAGPRDRAMLDRARRPLAGASLTLEQPAADGGRWADVVISPYHHFHGIEPPIDFRVFLPGPEAIVR